MFHEVKPEMRRKGELETLCTSLEQEVTELKVKLDASYLKMLERQRRPISP